MYLNIYIYMYLNKYIYIYIYSGSTSHILLYLGGSTDLIFFPGLPPNRNSREYHVHPIAIPK